MGRKRGTESAPQCHSNILGNEKADIAAQQATLSPEDEGIPIPSLDLRIAIKEIINRAWQERWSTQDTQLNNIKPDIKKWTYPKSFNRKEQVITCRLRIGHSHLTHAYLLAGDLRPKCDHCNTRLSITHVFSCPIYAQLRNNVGISHAMNNMFKSEEMIQNSLLYLEHLNIYITRFKYILAAK
ncbi:hypothetical protein JTB14_034873 [Gonioctena quinquepunctata]|nr:hypothetical protein JTB14_034873 [Gonioctena quinquepunctata]